MGPVGPRIGIYSNIEDVVYKLYYREKDFEAKQSWIYADLLMSVGPFGPGGGIYSIIEDVVCKVYSQKQIWRPNNRRYMQYCLCLWALSGYIQILRTLRAKHMS